MPQHHTAILLFSRTASAEAASKSFGCRDTDRRITEALISRAETTIARTGLRIFRSDEASQRGATFGERLANAMSGVFQQDVDQLLVIGNDCPQVTPSHLRSAARKLASGQNVIGPDRRGGVWLIGLQRADFDAVEFATLRWETNHVYGQLARILPGHCVATTLSDLTSFRDLSRQWFLLRRHLSELSDLLFSPAVYGPHPEQPAPVAIARRPGRAPPR